MYDDSGSMRRAARTTSDGAGVPGAEGFWLAMAAAKAAELTRGGRCSVERDELWDITLADGRVFEATQIEMAPDGHSTKIVLVSSAYGEISMVTTSEIVKAMKVAL